MSAMTAEEILTKAIEGWQKTGWTQGQSVDPLGRRCLVGGVQNPAFRKANQDQALKAIAEYQALKAIAEVICDVPQTALTVGETCVQWNDARGRTVEEVITAAEQARANLKRELDK